MTEWSREKIIHIDIEKEMSSAYIDYSMSVIVFRALPDVRDGLKPVHRRILYGIYELLGKNNSNFYKKSARIVGEILGKYHPHGDVSIYDAMVRMAQNWSLRYPLIEGQGNFGSIDGDSPAAMRYTEIKLSNFSFELIDDIDKDTVDFNFNFDDSLKEPVVLPSRFPNLIINGSSGIAVGMATNIPSHNLTEVVNGVIAYMSNNEILLKDLIKHITAPDFPTGGIIYGYQGVEDSFYTGRGRLILRSKSNIETLKSGKRFIVVTEIPYMVNKSLMIERTAQLINEKKIDGILDIRDESDKTGIRIMYELKKDFSIDLVLNNLYKKTNLQIFFNVNNITLVHGKPKLLNIRNLIEYFILHRHNVIKRRVEFNLKNANKKKHILEGYLIVFNDLNRLIDIVRLNKNVSDAKSSIMKFYNLSDIQSMSILNMKLQKITNFEIKKILKDYNELKLFIKKFNNVLFFKSLRTNIIRDELLYIQKFYGDKRRTSINYANDKFKEEDVFSNEKMVITVSYKGYIKKTLLSEYRIQMRGGIGSKGVSVKKDDFTSYLFVSSNHDYLLIFTENGRLYWKKVYNIPSGGKLSKGRSIQNLISINKDDKIKSILRVKNLEDVNYINNHYVVFCTEKGIIKKTLLKFYCKPRLSGINAIKINTNDKLLEVNITKGDNNIIMALRSGKAIHFYEKNVRSVGRISLGVKGVTLSKDDKVVSMVITNKVSDDLLVVSENGFGKRSNINDYRITKRGCKGIKTMQVTNKTGLLVSAKCVSESDEIMIINKSGIIIRISVSDIRIIGRDTQGVRLIRLQKDDKISFVEKIENIYK